MKGSLLFCIPGFKGNEEETLELINWTASIGKVSSVLVLQGEKE